MNDLIDLFSLDNVKGVILLTYVIFVFFFFTEVTHSPTHTYRPRVNESESSDSAILGYGGPAAALLWTLKLLAPPREDIIIGVPGRGPWTCALVGMGNDGSGVSAGAVTAAATACAAFCLATCFFSSPSSSSSFGLSDL